MRVRARHGVNDRCIFHHLTREHARAVPTGVNARHLKSFNSFGRHRHAVTGGNACARNARGPLGRAGLGEVMPRDCFRHRAAARVARANKQNLRLKLRTQRALAPRTGAFYLVPTRARQPHCAAGRAVLRGARVHHQLHASFASNSFSIGRQRLAITKPNQPDAFADENLAPGCNVVKCRIAGNPNGNHARLGIALE